MSGQNFPPPAGEEGSTAVHYRHESIVAWATQADFTAGYVDISRTGLGKVSHGSTGDVLGEAGDGTVMSLGDSGVVTLFFDRLIMNQPGYDFAVFENGFNKDFLELAFVEVSSDEKHFVRFPSVSLTPTTEQKGSFSTLDARNIHNLAGKYQLNYGTPFDLDELKDSAGIDLEAVRAIRLVDVIGSLDPAYASYDHLGNRINDPWPTPYDCGGFDLDGVAILSGFTGMNPGINPRDDFRIWPNPSRGIIHLEGLPAECHLALYNSMGARVCSAVVEISATMDLQQFEHGIYYLRINSTHVNYTEKILLIQ